MIRLLPVAAGLASIAITGVVATFSATSQSPASTASPSPIETSSPLATPSPEPESPTPAIFAPAPTAAPALTQWTPPAGYTGTLRPNVWIQITGAETCLNIRSQPGLVQPGSVPLQDTSILNCLPDGFIGQLSFYAGWEWTPDSMPVQADGYWWWYVLGQGWVAEDWLAFHKEESESPYPSRPELAGTGLIAFARTDGVWLASPDGASSRHLYPIDATLTSISDIRWSPDGQQLALSMWINGIEMVRIIDLDGTVAKEYAGLTQARWSPVGGWLSALQVTRDQQVYNLTPVIVDLATNAVTAVGSAGYYYGTPPEWAPDGSAVAFICRTTTWQEYLPDGSFIDHTTECGGDGIHITYLADGSSRVLWPTDPASDTYLQRLAWSPDGATISASGNGGDCQGYSLISVETGARTSCLALPNFVGFGGGCGGPSDSGESDWSPDGSTLAYHWQFQQGQNGVALVNVATGDRQMILTTGASSVGFSGDGAHLVFESSGYIWTADSDATDVARLTDGSLPAWQPVP